MLAVLLFNSVVRCKSKPAVRPLLVRIRVGIARTRLQSSRGIIRGEDHGPPSVVAVAMKVTWLLCATSRVHAPSGVEPFVQLHGAKPSVLVEFGK